MDNLAGQDADWCAEWAKQAIEQGRYELARCLMNLACQADRAFRATEGYNGPLVPVVPVTAPIGDELTQTFTAGQSEETQVVQPEHARVIPSARCNATRNPDGTGGECHAVLAWDEVNGLWYHLNGDQSHPPHPDKNPLWVEAVIPDE